VAGGSGEILQQVASDPEAVYIGAIDRAGTFELAITAAGYQPHAETGIVVQWNGCSLDGQRLEIALHPEPATAAASAWLMLIIDDDGVEAIAARMVGGDR
jgi:hypothetical protein